jgi:hypothetical protein
MVISFTNINQNKNKYGSFIQAFIKETKGWGA